MGTYNITSEFATEVTVPGPVAYSSVRTRAGFTLTEEIEADSPEEARDIALTRASEIAEDAKIAVAANAEGVTIAEDEDGIAQLTFESGKVAATAAAPTTPSGTDGASASGAPASSSTEPPIAHGNDRYTVLWNGVPRTVFDNREQEGNGPDFRMMPADRDSDEEPDVFWMKLKSGGENRGAKAIAAQIAEANAKATA